MEFSITIFERLHISYSVSDHSREQARPNKAARCQMQDPKYSNNPFGITTTGVSPCSLAHGCVHILA